MPPQDNLPRVSVIIPTYNRWHFLEQALKSVLDQTYPNIELIVVDDGSTDDTAQNLRDYQSRLVVIRQSNQGGTAARNTGLRAASGAFVAFLDHDDLLDPQKIARQVQHLEAHPSNGAVYTRWRYIDQQGRHLEKIGHLPDGDIIKDIFLGCFLWSGAPLVRRTWLERVGEFDIQIWSSDWDLWLRLAQSGCRFGCVQEPLGSYRILADSSMADVSRTEQADQAIFVKALAHSAGARPLAPLKAAALSNWRFWLSHRYYSAYSYEDGQRNLAEAVRLYPPRLANLSGFLQAVVANALDVRVDDGREYILRLLEHLPIEAESLSGRREFLLSRTLIGMALKDAGQAKWDAAQALLGEALAADKSLRRDPHAFAHLLSSYALRLPVSPLEFAQAFWDLLPFDEAAAGIFRSEVWSAVQVGAAFDDFYAGRRAAAVRRTLDAVRRRPGWLRNRGVLALLARSATGVGA